MWYTDHWKIYANIVYIVSEAIAKKKNFNRFFRIIPPWSEWKSDIPAAITSVAIALHWKYFKFIFINLRLLPIPIANTIDQAGYFSFFYCCAIFFCTPFVARGCNENRPWERQMLERGRFATFHWINNNIITIRTWTEHPQRPSMTCGHKFNPICKYFIESLVDMRRVNV